MFTALVGSGDGEVFLDTPQPNREAIALAEAHGLRPVFETARMYTGSIRRVVLQRVFGVTTSSWDKAAVHTGMSRARLFVQ